MRSPWSRQTLDSDTRLAASDLSAPKSRSPRTATSTNRRAASPERVAGPEVAYCSFERGNRRLYGRHSHVCSNPIRNNRRQRHGEANVCSSVDRATNSRQAMRATISGVVSTPTGCGAAWLARLTGGQEVASSNLASPTSKICRSQTCGPSRPSFPRTASHRGDDDAASRCASEDRVGEARTRERSSHTRHVLARPAKPASRCSRNTAAVHER